AASLNVSLDFNLQEAEFAKRAEEVIAALTGSDRPLIPALSAQHHFLTQLILHEVDNAINEYKTPGVTMSIETPCPCDPENDLECNPQDGVIDGIVRYDSDAHAYIWDFAAGYADLENKRPMTINTRFRIGSLTKSFVAMTILKLIEEGEFNLHYNHLIKDDNYLPESVRSTFIDNFDIPSPNGKNYADAVTIASVMNHSAGISNFYKSPSDFFLANLFEPEKQWDVEGLVNAELAKGPLYYPGEGMTYSNTGYSILGLLIENVTGKPWEEVIREQIIRPFELDDIIVPETGEALITGPYVSDPNNNAEYAYGYMSLYGATGGIYQSESAMQVIQERYGINIYPKEGDPLTKRDIQDPSSTNSAGNMIGTAPALRSWIKLIANTGDDENGLFGSDFNWLKHDSDMYKQIFFPLNENLAVGANVYHNLYDQRYIISGNLSGYDVNATYDINNKIAVGACGNRSYDETSMPEHSGPDIWKFDGADSSHSSVQIKDVLVFNTIDILTR
ncbi:MAG: beta-lactamase family protein, partial [Desulfamplus sp.]|nr:beta-lactamase family protein [Desulfamplus sp.]